MDAHTDLIEATRQYVESQLAGDGSGHDWWHVYRVWTLGKTIAEAEGADRLIVELASLLHDIGDWKFHDGDETVGPRLAAEWLRRFYLDEKTISTITRIVENLSFKGAGVPTPMETLEGKVVQDADRLDALGAIGIARAFAYGGSRNRLIHHPDIPPGMHSSFEDYKNNEGPSINHFYEKLLLLKDRMNTAKGKKIAGERHRFMELYLDRFFKEWDGE